MLLVSLLSLKNLLYNILKVSSFCWKKVAALEFFQNSWPKILAQELEKIPSLD
jgi:hypothetical protein